MSWCSARDVVDAERIGKAVRVSHGPATVFGKVCASMFDNPLVVIDREGAQVTSISQETCQFSLRLFAEGVRNVWTLRSGVIFFKEYITVRIGE